ncbi:hypothetical protein [Streptomyces minutiscleroticus]|uniref:hypothetical protein n=1 Tax=Streptomyces minutiscleroticus TaxID=68238 RepID=UPI0033283124
MIADRDGRHLRDDAGEALAARAEGYLMAQSHWQEARREAETLCAALPWLTAAQAEEVSRHCVERHTDLVRRTLRGTVRRADELRREYGARCHRPRRSPLRRHAAGACGVPACVTGINAALWVFVR